MLVTILGNGVVIISIAQLHRPTNMLMSLALIDIDMILCNPLRYSTKITIPIAWLMVFASWAVAA
ncbi:unnamed protein product, partial [Coregonus sp. 'balchen']